MVETRHFYYQVTKRKRYIRVSRTRQFDWLGIKGNTSHRHLLFNIIWRSNFFLLQISHPISPSLLQISHSICLPFLQISHPISRFFSQISHPTVPPFCTSIIWLLLPPLQISHPTSTPFLQIPRPISSHHFCKSLIQFPSLFAKLSCKFTLPPYLLASLSSNFPPLLQICHPNLACLLANLSPNLPPLLQISHPILPSLLANPSFNSLPLSCKSLIQLSALFWKSINRFLLLLLQISHPNLPFFLANLSSDFTFLFCIFSSYFP